MWQRVVAVVGLCCIAGCATGGTARLPDYARPRVWELPPGAPGARDPIRYRELTREDFRASEPHSTVARHASGLGAHLCKNLVPSPESKVWLEPLPDGSGFVATPKDVAYLAEVDRACSWWNDDSTVPATYVLQHEQIHFAIAEVVARRITREQQHLRGRGATVAEAEKAFQLQSDALVRRAAQEMAARDLEFDQDTSLGYAPSVQDAWYRKLMSELGQ